MTMHQLVSMIGHAFFWKLTKDAEGAANMYPYVTGMIAAIELRYFEFTADTTSPKRLQCCER